MSRVKCLKCGDTLYETVLDDGLVNGAFDVTKGHLPLEHDPDTGQPFMKCQHCGTKNGFREVGDGSGHPKKFALDHVLK